MSLKKRAISGVKWTTISTIVVVAVSMLKLSVLARFLDKSDFGLMALVNVVLAFMGLFMDMGLTSAILHKQNISKNEYSSLFWLNFGFSFFLYVIIILLSPTISSFYDEIELENILYMMGLSLVFSALGRQFKTIEQKNFNFKLISMIDIVTHILSLILAIYLVLNKFGVYSLVYSALFQFFVSNLVFLILGVHKNGLKLYFRFEETKPFLKIGIYQVGGQSISYFSKNFDILIIGKLLGSEVLGAYNLAKQLVGKPIGLLNPILTKVATPSFSIIQNNKLLLKEKYLDFINLGSSLSFFFYGFIILFASIIVDVLYGEEFNNIVNLVRILAVYYYLRSVFNYSGSLLTALGRTDLDFYWNCLSLFVFPTFIYLGAFNGVYGVGWSLVLAMLLSIYPYWKFLIHKMVDCSFGEYIQQTIPNLKIAKVLYKKK